MMCFCTAAISYFIEKIRIDIIVILRDQQNEDGNYVSTGKYAMVAGIIMT